MNALPTLCLASALAQIQVQQQPQTQAPTQQTAVDPSQLGTVSGMVVNAMTKEPLRRSEVTLMPTGARGMSGSLSSAGSFGPDGPAGTRRVQTDNEGKYSFTGVSAGKYNLMARRTGFLDGRYGARTPRGPGTQIEVSAGQSINSIKVELTPQAVIAGRVVDEEGEAVQGAQVQVLAMQYMRGTRRRMPMGGNQTNDKGEFRITNVPPGNIYLQVSMQRFGMGGSSAAATEDKPDMAYVPTFYPGTTDPSQASKIDVTAGAELSGFEFRLQKVRVYRIKGKLVDESTGQPPKGYTVNLMPRDMGFFPMMGPQFNRGNDGTFDLRNVAPGSYTLMVQTGMGGGPGGGMVFGPGAPGARMHYSEPIDVGSQNVEGLVVRIPPPVKVTGQITKNSDSQQLDVSGFRPMLQDSIQMFGSRPLTPKEDGSFESDSMSPGKYRVMLMGQPDQFWIESIKYGDQDVLGQEFEISGAAAPIRIVVGNDGGTISGNVTNSEDQPAPAASIVLIPQDKNRRALGNGSVRTAETTQNSSFTFSNVAPGKYWLIALEQVEYGFWDDEEQLRKIEGKAKSVEVARKGSQSATLKLTTMPN